MRVNLKTHCYPKVIYFKYERCVQFEAGVQFARDAGFNNEIVLEGDSQVVVNSLLGNTPIPTSIAVRGLLRWQLSLANLLY